MLSNPRHNLTENLPNTWPVLTVFIGLILGTKKIKDRRTPTHLGNSYEVAPARVLNCTHCHSPVHGGFEQTRNKRLQRHYDFVSHMFFQLQGWGPPTLTRGLLESETEPCELSAAFVFAVLVSNRLGFLSLPLCWVFFMFIFHHGSLAELGFWCAWPPPHRVQAKVVSSRLNPSHGTIYVPGV